MPRGDGTGPMGAGPMTGRGAGYCAGFAVPGCFNNVGFGGGTAGRGRRHRWLFYATGLPGWLRLASADPSELDGKAFLRKRAEFLERQLKQVKKLLAEDGEAEAE